MEQPKIGAIKHPKGLVRFLGKVVKAVNALKLNPTRREFEALTARVESLEDARAATTEKDPAVVYPEDAKLDFQEKKDKEEAPVKDPVDFTVYNKIQLKEFAKSVTPPIEGISKMSKDVLIAKLLEVEFVPPEKDPE